MFVKATYGSYEVVVNLSQCLALSKTDKGYYVRYGIGEVYNVTEREEVAKLEEFIGGLK